MEKDTKNLNRYWVCGTLATTMPKEDSNHRLPEGCAADKMEVVGKRAKTYNSRYVVEAENEREALKYTMANLSDTFKQIKGEIGKVEKVAYIYCEDFQKRYVAYEVKAKNGFHMGYFHLFPCRIEDGYVAPEYDVIIWVNQERPEKIIY